MDANQFQALLNLANGLNRTIRQPNGVNQSKSSFVENEHEDVAETMNPFEVVEPGDASRIAKAFSGKQDINIVFNTATYSAQSRGPAYTLGGLQA